MTLRSRIKTHILRNAIFHARFRRKHSLSTKRKEKARCHKTVSEVRKIDLVTKTLREMTRIDSSALWGVGGARVKLKVKLSCSTAVKGFRRIKQLWNFEEDFAYSIRLLASKYLPFYLHELHNPNFNSIGLTHGFCYHKKCAEFYVNSALSHGTTNVTPRRLYPYWIKVRGTCIKIG
jgi:hypothetical protein